MLARPLILLASALGALAAYQDLGPGKCTVNGKDPLYSYHPNKGEVCEQLCDESRDCFGYSTSMFNNCLLWDESDLSGGGAEWGDAHCFVQHESHKSARGQCSCDREGACAWLPLGNCVEDFRYKGANFSNCTTSDYHNVGWCSHNREYVEGEWSMCTLQCPTNCFWSGRGSCSPVPKESSECWHPPSACVPMFSYRGGFYHGCTTIDNGRTGWCSHYFNFGAYGKWSNCTPCQTTIVEEATCAGKEGGGGVPRLLGSAVVGAVAGAALLWTALRRQGNSARSANTWAMRRWDDLE